jgi:hypothetical protein
VLSPPPNVVDEISADVDQGLTVRTVSSARVEASVPDGGVVCELEAVVGSSAIPKVDSIDALLGSPAVVAADTPAGTDEVPLTLTVAPSAVY